MNVHPNKLEVSEDDRVAIGAWLGTHKPATRQQCKEFAQVMWDEFIRHAHENPAPRPVKKSRAKRVKEK